MSCAMSLHRNVWRGRWDDSATMDQRQPNAVNGDRPPTDAAPSNNPTTAPPDDELFPVPTAAPMDSAMDASDFDQTLV